MGYLAAEEQQKISHNVQEVAMRGFRAVFVYALVAFVILQGWILLLSSVWHRNGLSLLTCF